MFINVAVGKDINGSYSRHSIMVYEPREDSFLLLKHISRYAKGRVLDMGTGSGILAVEAAKTAKEVVAADINRDAIAAAKGYAGQILFIRSDLFAAVKGTFDLIVFNPPYLPADRKHPDAALDGGRHGYETIARFLAAAGKHLSSSGHILLLFSSLTKKEKVDEFIEKYGFAAREIDRQQLFQETLYVYDITKSPLLREWERKGITAVEKFAHGKRGVVYVGTWKGKKVAVKTEKSGSRAVARIKMEGDWLRRLNRREIGPRLLLQRKDYFCYEFVEGKEIMEFISGSSKGKIISAVAEVLRQCRELDKLQVNKEEMHHPYKHILIAEKPVLIDFERCRYAEKPKNVTQFVQFLVSAEMEKQLAKKGIKLNKQQLLTAARWYKKQPTEANMQRISKLATSGKA